MAKKLKKKIEGTVLTIEIDGVEEALVFDTAELPDDMKDKLIPSGAGHKLGDSAAGAKTPEEAVASIQRVWEAMMNGNWTSRVPAAPKEKAPKVNIKALLENINKLPEDQQAQARALLAAIGVSLDQ